MESGRLDLCAPPGATGVIRGDGAEVAGRRTGARWMTVEGSSQEGRRRERGEREQEAGDRRRPHGEIGKRSGFKIRGPRGRPGSTPGGATSGSCWGFRSRRFGPTGGEGGVCGDSCGDSMRVESGRRAVDAVRVSSVASSGMVASSGWRSPRPSSAAVRAARRYRLIITLDLWPVRSWTQASLLPLASAIVMNGRRAQNPPSDADRTCSDCALIDDRLGRGLQPAAGRGDAWAGERLDGQQLPAREKAGPENIEPRRTLFAVRGAQPPG